MHPRTITFIDELPSTRHGKLDRAVLLAASQNSNGTTPPGRGQRGTDGEPQNATETKLLEIWQSLLEQKQIGVHDDFFELGGNSLLALRMFNKLEQETTTRVPLASLVQHRTIRSIASIVEGEDVMIRNTPVVELQPQGNRPPVFCVHGIGGEVVQLTTLVKHLPLEQPFFGFQAMGRDSADEPFSTIEKMAEYYLEHMRDVQPEGPYYVAGYSFGGSVAFEMAQQLMAAGETVAALIVIDTASQTYVRDNYKWIYIPRFFIHLPIWFFGDYLRSGWRKIWTRPMRLLRLAAKRLWDLVKPGKKDASSVDVEAVFYAPDVPEHYRRLYEAHYRALRAYKARPYSGKVTLLRSRITGLFGSLEKDLGWKDVADGGVEVNYVCGSHATMLDEPHVEALANTLSRVALEAQVIQNERATATTDRT
jgi:thioesterase domain-containing protein